MPSGWKYIAPTGKPALEGVFLYAESFLNGRAIVMTKDGWTKVIDPQGNTILQVPSGADANKSVLSRLGKSFIVHQDVSGKRVLSLNGELILNNLSSVVYPHGDTIPFASEDRLGYLLPDGRIRWVEKSDFVLDYHREKGARYVLKDFDCPVEGLLDPSTGEWIVAPKMCQYITAYDEMAPFAFVYDQNGQKSKIVDRNTGEVIPVELDHLQHLEGGLGWLLVNTEAQTGWLYSHDFKTKRPWNYLHRNIHWQEEVGLFRVSDIDMNMVGYISKNGRVLFED